MPFGGIDRPALGVSLLKSRLAEQGFKSDIAYFNIRFAEIVGLPFYGNLSNMAEFDQEDGIPNTAMAGEWLFSQYFYGNDEDRAQAYINAVLKKGISDRTLKNLLHVRSLIPGFLEECLNRVDWHAYAMVGFTTTFEQNLASLSLARLVKQHYPHLFIAFGGANCESVMGLQMAKEFPFIDAVCTGEGDETVPEMVKALSEGRSLKDVKGLAWRDGAGNLIDNGPPDVINDLDKLEPPNFDDYFDQLMESSAGRSMGVWLQMEASRGCWWGAKSHCTFCGLNGRTMAYRRKNPERLLKELRYLVQRYNLRNISFVDNILDYDGYTTFVPELAQSKESLRIFFEIKSNLRKDQVKLLADAGIVDVQPGIESLSTPVLRLMGKGVSALQNIAFMKWAKQYGVRAFWNILYGFPKETAEEYENQLIRLKAITHLEAPASVSRIRLDRFSPNHTKAAQFGFKNVTPLKPYKYLYPFDEESLSNLCYFFDYEYQDERDPNSYVSDTSRFWLEWMQVKNPGELKHFCAPDGTGKILDTRFNRKIDEVPLNRYQNAIYCLCDQPTSFTNIMSTLRKKFPEREFEKEKIKTFLNYMLENRLMVKEDNSYLSVAIQQ